MKIVVLLGGVSGERAVSLASGCEVSRALREAGHEVQAFDPACGPLSREQERSVLETGLDGDLGALFPLEERSLSPLLQDPSIIHADLVFPALHGGMGEDGRVQAILEVRGVPYVGSPPLGCALAMDKDLTKRLFLGAGIRTPAWTVGPEYSADPSGLEMGGLEFPVIVKPVDGGSSLGLHLVHDENALKDILSSFDRTVGSPMVESYVEGRELTVGVVGDEALPVGEIVPRNELFDYECKYRSGMAEEIFPADISGDLSEELKGLALRAHRTLRLRHFSRVDFMVDRGGRAWCLEANALPGLTANSLLPKAGVAYGWTFPELCDRLVRLASERRR